MVSNFSSQYFIMPSLIVVISSVVYLNIRVGQGPSSILSKKVLHNVSVILSECEESSSSISYGILRGVYPETETLRFAQGDRHRVQDDLSE